MCSLIINIASERFGMKKHSTNGPGRPNQWVVKITICVLRRQFKQARQENKAGVVDKAG